MAMYSPGRPFKWNFETREGTVPPEGPGLYSFYEGAGIYYGTTMNLARRIAEHFRNNRAVEFQYKIADRRATSRTLYAYEKEFIKRKIQQGYKLVNRSEGGEGRLAIDRNPRNRKFN